jgi:hypothetical protein
MSDTEPALRKYSIAEIDGMRKSVERMSYTVGGPNGGPEFEAKVEDRLRTYMIAGVDPEGLSADAGRAYELYSAKFVEYLKQQEEFREQEGQRVAEAMRRLGERTRPKPPRIFSREWWG